MAGRGFLTIGILVFQLVGSTLAADTLATRVESLLDTTTISPSKALEAARAQYKQLRSRPDFDARAQYAFALILVQQRRFDEGRRVLDEVLREQPDMLSAWQTKVWAALAAHTYAVALDDMRAAAAESEKIDADAAGDSQERRQALARLMGRGIGFLAATEKTKISAAKLKAARGEILEKLGPDRGAFLAGEKAIVQEMAALDDKLTGLRQAEETALLQQDQEQKKKQRTVSKAAAEVDYQILKTQADSEAQLRGADWEVEQLQKNFAKTQFDMNAIGLALLTQQQRLQDTVQWLEQANRDIDAGRIVDQAALRRNNLILPIMNNNIRQLGEQHVALAQRVGSLQSELRSAIGRRDGVVGESEATASQLESNARKLQHDEKKLEYAGKHSKSRPGVSGGKRAIVEKRQAFSSFEPFPFEQEKLLVLTWFKK